MFLWNRKVTLLALLGHSPTRLPNDDIMAQLQKLDQWSWCSHRHCHPTLTWCGGSQRILPRQRSKLCQCPWLLPSRDLSRLRIQAILFQTGKAVQQFSGQKKNSGAILDWNKWPLKKLLIVYFLGWMILNLPNIDLHPFRATIPGTATASMPGVLQVPKRPRAGTGPWRWCQVTVQRPLTWSITLLHKKCHDWKDMGSGHKAFPAIHSWLIWWFKRLCLWLLANFSTPQFLWFRQLWGVQYFWLIWDIPYSSTYIGSLTLLGPW